MVVFFVIATVLIMVSYIFALITDNYKGMVIFLCAIIGILFFMLGIQEYYNNKLDKALINHKAIEAKIINNKPEFVLIDNTYIDFWEIKK